MRNHHADHHNHYRRNSHQPPPLDPHFEAGFQFAQRAEEARRHFLHEQAQGLVRLQVLSLKAEIDALKQDLARRRQSASAPARKYSPDQPRLPAGESGGGQWTSGGGGESDNLDIGLWLPLADVFQFGETDNADARLLFNLAANDGTPRNNQAQNKQVNDVVRMLNLTQDERKQLHMEITGQNFGFQEILRIGREIKGK